MKKLRFALAGCGNIASRHAKYIKKYGYLVAVADPDASKAQSFALSNACKAYPSLTGLLQAHHERIDVVVVCTPNGLHYEQVEMALLHGLKVICEKPFTLQPEHGAALQNLSVRANKLLWLVQSMRYNPLIKQLLQLSQQNELGQYLHFNLQCIWNRPVEYYRNGWRGNGQMDGGPLFTQFSHYIDVITWLFGEIISANGTRQNLLHGDSVDFEDIGMVQVQTAEHIHGSIFWTTNAHQQNFEIGLTLLTDRLTLQLGGAYLNEVKYCSVPGLFDQAIAAMQQIPSTGYSFHEQVYEDFYDHLQSENMVYEGLSSGIQTIRSIRKIYASTPLIN